MAVRQGILGKKIGMTQVYDDTGQAVPVTVLEVGPCHVTQVKTKERDGYAAIQLGFGETQHLNRPLRGHLRDLPLLRHLREIRTDDAEEYHVGQVIDASSFVPGDEVDVRGTSKGRGFAGVVRRYGFRGGPKTRGQSDRHRAPGSIGAGSAPGHVVKGKRMPGHMGNARVTVQGLEVISVNPERNLLLVKGAVPGPKHGLVLLRKAVKTREALSRRRQAVQK